VKNRQKLFGINEKGEKSYVT